MSNFIKYVPPKNRFYSTPVSNLQIGEICFLPEKYGKTIYNRLYQQKRKYGKEFEFKEITNGILIKRLK